MVDALIKYLIQALLSHMYAATHLTWIVDKTNDKTFKIFTNFEHQGVVDDSIEISIVADSSEKFSYTLNNKSKEFSEENKKRMFIANDIGQKAKKHFDKFLDDNLFYHYINYLPKEYATGYNPVAPTIVLGPFISAGAEMTEEQINYIASQFKFIKEGLESGSLVYKRATKKKRSVDNIDNVLSNTEEM